MMKLLRYLWAMPNTLAGLLFLPLALLSHGRVTISQGVLEIHGGAVSWILKKCLLRKGVVSALTLGHVILGIDEDSLAESRDHERVHVRQYEMLGPFFLPVYLAASLWGWMKGRGAYRGNYFELRALEREQQKKKSIGD